MIDTELHWYTPLGDPGSYPPSDSDVDGFRWHTGRIKATFGIEVRFAVVEATADGPVSSEGGDVIAWRIDGVGHLGDLGSGCLPRDRGYFYTFLEGVSVGARALAGRTVV